MTASHAGPGSVAGAPHLPDGFAGTFTSRYVEVGGLRQHVVTGGDGPPLLAQAAPGPDEDVAAELARSAGRAQARGGLAAAAAYLERAAMLTPDPPRRAQRLLVAARAKRDAGALDAALDLLTAADAGPPDELRTAESQHLRGQISLEQRRGYESARLLIGAARRLESLDAGLARETYLQALGAALWAGESEQSGIMREVAAAARTAPPAPVPARAADVLLDGLAIRYVEGHTAAAPTLARALQEVLALNAGTDIDVSRWLWLAGLRAAGLVANELWDDGARHTLAARQVEVARTAGALVQLQYAVNFLAWTSLDAGETALAARLLDEDRLIADAAGASPVGFCAVLLAAWQGQERTAVDLVEATMRLATAGRMARLITVADHASAVLYNGLGRPDAARDAARKRRSPGWPERACRTRKSAPGSSSAREPSNGTCARCSPSSTSARAGSYADPCRSLSGAPCRFRANARARHTSRARNQ